LCAYIERNLNSQGMGTQGCFLFVFTVFRGILNAFHLWEH